MVGVPDAKKAAAEAALKRNVRLGEGKKKPNFGLKGILGQRREEAFLKIAKGMWLFYLRFLQVVLSTYLKWKMNKEDNPRIDSLPFVLHF